MNALLRSSDEALSVARELIADSSPFSLEPYPSDEWVLTFRASEKLSRVEAILGREVRDMRHDAGEAPDG